MYPCFFDIFSGYILQRCGIVSVEVKGGLNMKRIIRAACLAALLFGILPATARAEQLLIPVGRVIGIQLESGSVTVAAFDDVSGSRAREAGLRIGDEILKIDDRAVRCARDVRSALDSSGSAVVLTVRRSGRLSTIPLEPARENGTPRLEFTFGRASPVSEPSPGMIPKPRASAPLATVSATARESW